LSAAGMKRRWQGLHNRQTPSTRWKRLSDGSRSTGSAGCLSSGRAILLLRTRGWRKRMWGTC